MQLNEVHTEHEHATTSLKVVLLVFAIVLIGALGYLVWVQNNEADTTDYGSNVTKKTTTTKTETTSDETADWISWTRTEQNMDKFTFKTPKDWNVFGADNGGETNLRIADENYKDGRYPSGLDSDNDIRVSLYFNSTSVDIFTDWIETFGSSTNTSEVTIGGIKATLRLEPTGAQAYYLDLSNIHGSKLFLRAFYLQDGKNDTTEKSLIDSIDFNPSDKAIAESKQIP